MIARAYKTSEGFTVSYTQNGNQTNHHLKDEEEAKQKAFQVNYDYYFLNPEKLPKGIRINTSKEKFVFIVHLSGTQSKQIKESKDLGELIKNRKHLLKSLLKLH